MSRIRITEAQQIMENGKAADKHLNSLRMERERLTEKAQELETTHKQRLNMRDRIERVLLDKNLNDKIVEYGMTRVITDFFFDSSITIRKSELLNNVSVYEVDFLPGIERRDWALLSKQVQTLIDTLGIRSEFKNTSRSDITIDAKKLNEALRPIIQAKPEDRKAKIDELWARLDAEELEKGQPDVDVVKDRAAYLKEALGQVAPANGEQKKAERR